MLLRLFLSFFKIGAFTFGGGYAMIAMIRETVLTNGWLTEAELLNYIAISESTPGPIAINMATFVGTSQAGILGAAAATLGVVLPAFLIMLLIASVIHGLFRYRAVQGFLSGVRPAIVGLLLATALTMGLSLLFSLRSLSSPLQIDAPGLLILGVLLIAQGAAMLLKKKLSPVMMILLSAVLGLLIH